MTSEQMAAADKLFFRMMSARQLEEIRGRVLGSINRRSSLQYSSESARQLAAEHDAVDRRYLAQLDAAIASK